ncbi:MAG: hypothetical protein HQL76_11020 [Magnetococcales bacterium]|nr:hypothetical protein [Magnetococcales bacterium]
MLETESSKNPKDWFIKYWNLNFVHAVDSILHACGKALQLEDDKTVIGRKVAETFLSMHQHMKDRMQPANGDRKRLDRHKIAAAVAGAFLHEGIMLRTSSQGLEHGGEGMFPRRVIYANEFLALDCALQVLHSFMFKLCGDDLQRPGFQWLGSLDEKGWVFPSEKIVSPEHGIQTGDDDRYVTHLHNAMRQSQINRHCQRFLPSGVPNPPFDLFFLSMILFDIELYNFRFYSQGN